MFDLIADWGWQDADRPAGMIFIKGTLAESYERVTADGHRYLLRTAVPVSAYYAVIETLEGTTKP